VSSRARELRILFFMLHAGYIRHFRPAIELLGRRGHAVHLAFTRLEKDPGDARLAEELAATHPSITFGDAPLRRRSDGWRPLAMLVRSLVDLGRYTDPRYDEAPELRARMAKKLTEHVQTARAIDPLTRHAVLRVIKAIASGTGARKYRRLLRSLALVERAIPTSGAVDDYLRRRNPDVVLVTPLIEFASSQVDYVKSARKAGLPCGVCVASWDNLTGKGLFRVEPDEVFVWNETQVREAAEMHGVPREHIVTTGAAKFDEWFERAPRTSPTEFAAKVGLAPGRPYVLYVCSSPFIAPDEVRFVSRWLARLREDGRPPVRAAGILIRPHPQNAAQWRGVDLERFGNTQIWPRGGAQPDAGDARADFFDSLAHSSAVVGINTSVLLEAAIVGKSVLTPLAPEFAGTQLGTLHFRYLLVENGGFLRIGSTLDGHVDQLASALEGGDVETGRTRSFVASFLRPHGLDRPAAPILADAVERLADVSPTADRPRARDRVLRLALTPFALGARVVGSTATSLRPRRTPPAAEPI
jgi:hypothetical protein